MGNRRYPSETYTRSGTRRLSDGSSSATSMSTTDGFMTPSTGSSTPGRQPWSAGSEYGPPTDGYHPGEEMMLATPSNTLANLGGEPLPAQTGVSWPVGASVSYHQQALDYFPQSQGQGVDARTDPGQLRYATPGPGAMDHGNSSSGDDMAASTFVFPPSPPRPPGARSSTAVGENKSKTKTKKGTKPKTGPDKGTNKEKKGRGDTKNGRASNRSFSSAGPSAPVEPHQPYRSSEFGVPTQPSQVAGFDVSTQSYHWTGYNVAMQSYRPTQSYDPVGPNTQGIPDTPGTSWAGSQAHDDFNRSAFLSPRGLSAPFHYPETIAEHDFHDPGAAPGHDMDEEEEYDMVEDAKEAKNLDAVNNGRRSNNRRWRK